MKVKNIQMESMITSLKPLLDRRDKIGYIAARNTRMLTEALTEYVMFKRKLIMQYGTADTDENGNDLGTISIAPDAPNYDAFIKEFNNICDIEHDVELMTLPYKDVIGTLSGKEIMDLDWMMTDEEG